MAVARTPWTWAPFPSARNSRSLGALEMGSAPAWALWRLAPAGTVGQQPEDSCFSSEKPPLHFCRDQRMATKNVPCFQQAREIWLWWGQGGS